MNNSITLPTPPSLDSKHHVSSLRYLRTPSSCFNSWFLALLGFSFHTILSPNNNSSFINDRLRGFCLLFPRSFLGKTGKLAPQDSQFSVSTMQLFFFFFALCDLNTVALGTRSAGWMPLAETKRRTRVVS